MDKKVEFDFMWKDRVCSHIIAYANRDVVDCIDYTEDVIQQAFGKRPHTKEYLLAFFEERCFERGRIDKEILLRKMGLTDYNPYEIVLRTQGRLLCDASWVRFTEETLRQEKDYEESKRLNREFKKLEERWL